MDITLQSYKHIGRRYHEQSKHVEDPKQCVEIHRPEDA